jgi:hypothetical protein
MLLGLTRPLEPGDAVRVALRLSDGSSTSFPAVVKDYAGAKESYTAMPSASPTASR